MEHGDRPDPELLAQAVAAIRASGHADGPLQVEAAWCSLQFAGKLVVYIDDLPGDRGTTYTTFLVDFTRWTRKFIGVST